MDKIDWNNIDCGGSLWALAFFLSPFVIVIMMLIFKTP